MLTDILERSIDLRAYPKCEIRLQHLPNVVEVVSYDYIYLEFFFFWKVKEDL